MPNHAWLLAPLTLLGAYTALCELADAIYRARRARITRRQDVD